MAGDGSLAAALCAMVAALLAVDGIANVAAAAGLAPKQRHQRYAIPKEIADCLPADVPADGLHLLELLLKQ